MSPRPPAPNDLKDCVPLFVVDGFYPDPYSVRKLALRESFERPRDSAFPGLRSPARPFSHAQAAFFTRLLGRPPRREGSHAFFQYQTRGTANIIHFDSFPETRGWAALVYLSDGRDGAPGTRFYRHRQTGLTEVPVRAKLERLSASLSCDPKVLLWKLDRDGRKPRLWETLETVSLRFNRLVVYPKSVFHAPAPAFGRTKTEARLTQQFFFSA